MILHIKHNIVIFISFFVMILQTGWGQEQVISLTNPSFEDFPQHSVPPRGWTDCGFHDESPPDVQPSGAWGVFWPAMDGDRKSTRQLQSRGHLVCRLLLEKKKHD